MSLGIAHHNQSFDNTTRSVVVILQETKKRGGGVMQTTISIFFQLHGHTPDQTKVSKQELAFIET